MKIILCSHGGYPKNIYNYMINKDLKFPYIYMIDNFNFNNIKTVENSNEAREESLKNNYCYLKYSNSERLYFKEGVYIYSHSIEEIDISRLWTIEEYDGSLNIKYIEYDIINKDIGYCKFKEEIE